MTNLFCDLIDFVAGFLSFLFPANDYLTQMMGNVNNNFNFLFEFLETVNFIIPLTDIITVLLIVVGFKVAFMGVFGVNWVINKFFQAI